MSKPPAAQASKNHRLSWPYLLLGAIAVGVLYTTGRRFSTPTLALTLASILMFAACLWAAHQLMGKRSADLFAGLALPIGWFAEQMGSSRGWFFGRYSYTNVLGIELGNVPLVIPIMWFALCLIGYVMACLLLWRQPVLASPDLHSSGLTALLAAMIVTAFDLGGDPYFVFVLKAWVMEKTDGGWFGETLQGFVGWMLIASLILVAFQWLAGPKAVAPVTSRTRLAAMIPLAIYGGEMLFQMIFGQPIEVRAIAFFAMGMPLLVASVAWWQWKSMSAGVGS